MLLKLRNSNLLSIVLGARGTFLICFILLSCYLLYSVLAYTFLIPAGNFLGDIPSVLRGEFWRIITSTVYHYEWEHLLKNMLAIIVLGPFIEWKTGSFALVTSFFLSSWIGVLLFSFGFGGFIQSTFGIGTYIYSFYGASMSVYGLFPMAIIALLIKKPAFSLMTKFVLLGSFLYYFIVGFWPNPDASDTEVVVQIAHSCGFLAGLLCVLIILILRNRKKIFSYMS